MRPNCATRWPGTSAPGAGCPVAAVAAGRARGRGRSASDSADIRAWAKENGYEVSERGRISAEVRAAYNEAK